MTSRQTIKPSPPSAETVRRTLLRHGRFDHLDFVQRGSHLIIRDAGAPDEPIARITATSHRHFTADFRNHRGKWEPLPIEGDIEATVAGLIELIGPFLLSMD